MIFSTIFELTNRLDSVVVAGWFLDQFSFGSLIHSNKRKSLSKMAVKCVYLIKDHINAFSQFPHTKRSSEENGDFQNAAVGFRSVIFGVVKERKNGGKMAIFGFLVRPMNQIGNDCVNMGIFSDCKLKFYSYLPE